MRCSISLAITVLGWQISVVHALSSLAVDTTSGRAYGMVNGSNPGVAQFLGVPYGEAPVGSLRFQAPEAKKPVDLIDATKSGPICPQYWVDNATLYPNIYSIDEPWLQPSPGWSEDCLNLNIWAPYSTQANGTDLLPVIIWIFGGGFYEGGTNTPGMDASYWVQRSQEHIVVAMNARTNIFGFPNSKGLSKVDENVNVGLLDQRLAIEWVRDNIAAFGGNSSQMVVWGQSSGSASTDYLNYAYPEDPIVKGFIQHSGSVFATGESKDPEMLNFTSVAQNVGCGNLSSEDELYCMQHNASASDIVQYYQNYNIAHTEGQLSFTTIVDGITKFSNYTERALAGNFSKLPVICGTNAHETASLIDWPFPEGPNMTDIAITTLSKQQCPLNYNTDLRAQLNVTTFRYYNNASFPNISPGWWEGAYHTSELPLIFGTFSVYGNVSATPLEHATSAKWQDLYVAFARDPENALPALGWPAYNPKGQAWMWNPKNRNGSTLAVSKLIPAQSLISPCNNISWSIMTP